MIKQTATIGRVPTVLTTTLNQCPSTTATAERTLTQSSVHFIYLIVAVRSVTNQRISIAYTRTAISSAILAREFLERSS